MYRKEPQKLNFKDFNLPIGGHLDGENRWVKNGFSLKKLMNPIPVFNYLSPCPEINYLVIRAS